MADETLTGAKTEVVIDNEATDKKKKMIKIAVIAVVIIVVGYIVWKKVLKK